MKKKSKPKNSQELPKVNPINAPIPPTTTTATSDSFILSTAAITYKCDNPKCSSPAELFFNLKYCKSCAKDKNLDA